MAKAKKIIEVEDDEANDFLRIRSARIILPVEQRAIKVKVKKIDKDLIPRKPKPKPKPFNPKAKPVRKKGRIVFRLLDAQSWAQHSPAEALAQIKRNRLKSVKVSRLVKLGIETPNVLEVVWCEILKKYKNGQIEAKIQEPCFHRYMHGLDQGKNVRFSLRNVMDVAIHGKVIDRKVFFPV